MAIKDIIVSAKQIRKEADATQAQEQEQKRAIEQVKAEQAKTEFKKHLGTEVQALFDELDEKPRFYYANGYGAGCKLTVYHRIIELRINGIALHHDQPEWVVSSDYKFQEYSSEQSRTYKTEYVRGKDLATRLALLILDIAEDHEQLLPKIEAKKVKVAKQAELDRQSKEYEALLAEADRKSAEQIQGLVPELQAFSWTWPNDVVIPLYKIRWCIGAYRDPEYDDASLDFEYASGWALSDVPDRAGYFTLLPEKGKVARKIQPVHLSEVECVYASSLGDIPAALTEKVNHEIEIIVVGEMGEWYDDKYVVLPHLLPVAPEGASVSTTTKTHPLELGIQPIIEIRRAIDSVAYEPVSDTAPF